MPSDEILDRLRQIRSVDLTTIGRRSRWPARIEIWWFSVADRLIITGTPGKRDWYANVLADPRLVIHTSIGDFTARATAVLDPVFRRRFFANPEVGWYKTQSDVEHLVADAPMARSPSIDTAHGSRLTAMKSDRPSGRVMRLKTDN